MRDANARFPWISLLLSLATGGCSVGSSGIVMRTVEPRADDDAEQLLRDVYLDFLDEEGRVDYDGLRRRPRLLKRYLGAVAGGPGSEEPAARKAFWINVHNALVLRATSLHAPLVSVDGLPSVFRRARIEVDGRALSADEILARELRPLGDPRILFVLRMGSVGCPTTTRVFTAATVEAELQNAMLEELGRPRTVRTSPTDDAIALAAWMQSFAPWFGDGGARVWLANALERPRPSLARALRSPRTEVGFLPRVAALDARP